MPREKVRHEQARILKKEKKYIPATDMIMGEHLLKYSNKNGLNRDAFKKDAGVCIRALKWDEAILDDMVDIISSQLSRRDYDEGHLHNTYDNLLINKGLLNAK